MLDTLPMTTPAPLATGEALATLAHELRDPLAAILLALELHSGDGDPAARRTLTMAAHQARRAVRIVDDLFDLCAGSRDSLPLCKEEVDLAAVVAGATEATAHLLAARGHRLTVSLPAGPVSLVADPVRLEQVLINLLANAAKFTAPGGDIGLTARAEAGQVVLVLRDNGPGIASEPRQPVIRSVLGGPGPRGEMARGARALWPARSGAPTVTAGSRNAMWQYVQTWPSKACSVRPMPQLASGVLHERRTTEFASA